MKGETIVSCICVAVISGLVCYRIGVWAASERFYEECQGGEVHYKLESGTMLTAVGCAEIARHIR